MRVTVMQVGHVRMAVGQRHVTVGMGVRLGGVDVRRMRVLVVAVLQRRMGVVVRVPLPEEEHHAEGHEHRGEELPTP